MDDRNFLAAVRGESPAAPIPPKDTDDDALTPEEAHARLDRLTEKDWLALDAASRKYRAWLAEDGEEVLGEAVQRILDGRRKWPRHVETAPFLAEVMRSVAWEWLQKRRRRAIPESRLGSPDASDPDEDEGYIERHPASGSGPDGLARIGAIIKHVETVFGDDDAVTAVILGRVEGMSPEDVQKEFGITQNQYAAAQKRLRRAVLAGRMDEVK